MKGGEQKVEDGVQEDERGRREERRKRKAGGAGGVKSPRLFSTFSIMTLA